MPHNVPCNIFLLTNLFLFIVELPHTANVCIHIQAPPNPTVKPVKKAETKVSLAETEANTPDEISSVEVIISVRYLFFEFSNNTLLMIEKKTVKPQISSTVFTPPCTAFVSEVSIGSFFALKLKDFGLFCESMYITTLDKICTKYK